MQDRQVVGDGEAARERLRLARLEAALRHDVAALRRSAAGLKAAQIEGTLAALEERLDDRTLSVLVLGEFNRGKSALIMWNHGLLTVGRTIAEAFAYMRRLVDACELQERVSALREDIRNELLATFRDRVNEIAQQAGVAVPEERIAQEVVMMVERGDIAEEITRLAHHVEQIARAIDQKEAAGKKLDFLSQEMLREINTMGSKSRSAALRTVVVELKTEVERIREQVQNVE